MPYKELKSEKKMAQPGLVYKSHRVRSSYVVLLHLEWGVFVCAL